MNNNSYKTKYIVKNSNKNFYISNMIFKPEAATNINQNDIQEFDINFDVCSKKEYKNTDTILSTATKNSYNRVCDKDCQICCLEQHIAPNWKIYLEGEIAKPYFKKLKKVLHFKSFVPPVKNIFTFTQYFAVEHTKVVIVGQDPFHDTARANGLAFSSDKISSSLRNMFHEVKRTYSNFHIPKHGNLEHWAHQGVLLLNIVLTVEINRPGSHKNIGWEMFTKNLIAKISDYGNIVFMLWGKNAQTLTKHIKSNNLILISSHPSAKGVREVFVGNNHFILANEYLKKNNKKPISW